MSIFLFLHRHRFFLFAVLLTISGFIFALFYARNLEKTPHLRNVRARKHYEDLMARSGKPHCHAGQRENFEVLGGLGAMRELEARKRDLMEKLAVLKTKEVKEARNRPRLITVKVDDGRVERRWVVLE
tara:strand:- start:11811 stop:12194 length:384 start_codon:yes stop_codon:yes gene_type:complete